MENENLMANSADNSYTTICKWEIDNVMSLEQATGEYVQSPIFTSNGPYGQKGLKWILRLFPRGENAKEISGDDVPVSVFLYLLDGNGSNYVKVDWKLAILNEKGIRQNEHEQKSCLFDMEVDAPNNIGWGFPIFTTRPKLDRNYIVCRKLILHSQITIRVEKDLQADVLIKTELTNSLKRKLDAKEEENEKIRSDFHLCQKRHRAEIEKLKEDHLAAIEKCKKEEKDRHSKNLSAYAKYYGKQIANLEKEKETIEKGRKEEEKRSNELRLDYLQHDKRWRKEIEKLKKEKLDALEKCKKIQGKYEKLSNFMRNSSKLVDEIENDENDN